MARFRALLYSSIVLLCMLCKSADVEQCTSGSEPGSSVCSELMSLYEKSVAEPPTVLVDTEDTKMNHRAPKEPRAQGPVASELMSLYSKTVGEHSPLGTHEEVSPLMEAASQLADTCTVPDDQASCDKAIRLAGLLETLTHGKSQDIVAEASNVSLLRSWFRNPAGPGGFFNFLDTDRSGSLNATELSEHGATGLMELVDADSNGQASRKECRDFLRGCTVLFKKMPTQDSLLQRTSIPVMLADADTVTMESIVATGPSSNPLSQAASELEQNCPHPAEQASCDKAVTLANFLAMGFTAGTAPEEIVAKAGTALQLWYWFQHPEGPAGFFKAVDRHKKDSHTAADIMAVAASVPSIPHNPAIPDLVGFADANKDDRISRAECRDYLGACVVLMQKLPMLDIVSASKPVSEVFMLVDSLNKL